MDKPSTNLNELVVEIERHNEFGWLVQDVHRLLAKCFDMRAKSVGLTRAQWRVLAQLIAQDGRTQTELADVIQIEKAPLGRMLDKLEQAGWIYRQHDEADRRVRRVFLTSRVEPHIEAVYDASKTLVEDALDGMGDHEIATLKATLLGVRSRLQKEAVGFSESL